MPLPVPKLDDRTFQDIVYEARRLIPRYCPEWTDHNLSDPGITLIELFAWMTDLILYRLNRVPEKNYITFLNLIGVRLETAHAARADVTFRLSAPQPQEVVIPQGTEVATVRTETQEAVVFSTDEDLHIVVPTLQYCLTSQDNVTFQDQSAILSPPATPFAAFAPAPQPGNTVYFGFRENLSGNTLVLTFDCDIEGIGVDPRNPPLVWEHWDGENWSRLELESDTTGGLNRRGQVTLYIPYDMANREVSLRRAWWIRSCVIKPAPLQPFYSTSPQIKAVAAETIGGTVPASHAVRVKGERLGISSGLPGQVFHLANAPVLSRRPGETVEVETEEGTFEPWEEAPDFSQSGLEDKHFVLDSTSGETRFGPAIRQPNGTVQQYGAIPPKGKPLRFSAYRYGGGRAGNLGAGSLTVLKSSIPYVASVTNRRAAIGGTDPETLENAMLRGPQLLRIRNRAVTAEDFEFLALEASSAVARARCLQAHGLGEQKGSPPGVVQLLIVPKVVTTDDRITPEQLVLTKELEEEIHRYLDGRRLLTTVLLVGMPRYLWVSVEVHIRVKPKANAQQVQREVERELYRFLNPVYGGPEGKGWPFGRALYISEIYSRVQEVKGVEHVLEAKLFLVDIQTNQLGPAVQKIEVPEDALISSHRHHIGIASQ
ncbi:MAG: putative baseplate assembly protein [Chloroflexota bacterium]